MPKITPFLWFDNNAEEAINFYVGIFKNARILSLTRMPEGGPAPAGSVISGSFEIEGQVFHALNGGPQFKFTEAVSFFIDCQSQEEIDYYWDKLIEGGGSPSMCGWLKDRFGLSWQVVPGELNRMLNDPDPAKAQRTMQAMLAMQKLDLDALRRAHAG